MFECPKPYMAYVMLDSLTQANRFARVFSRDMGRRAVGTVEQGQSSRRDRKGLREVYEGARVTTQVPLMPER